MGVAGVATDGGRLMLLGKKCLGTVAYMGGIPALPEPFVWSWSQMQQFNSEYLVGSNGYVFYDRATVSYHALARNSLASRMMGDWLLMFDVDHVFEPDIVSRLLLKLNRHGVDVLTAIYQYKSPPHMPVLYMEGKDENTVALLGKWDGDAEIMEIAAAGAGCLMVRRSVFDRIRAELHEDPFDIRPPFSEDHSFFARLRQMGIKAYFDPSIEANHLTYKPVTLADYDTEAAVYSERIEVAGYAAVKG